MILAVCVPEVVQAQPAIRALTSFEGEDREPALSPDGEWIAYLSDRKGDRSNELWLLNLRTRAERRLYSQHSVLGPPVWTKGGTHLVASLIVGDGPARLHSIDVETGNAGEPLLAELAETGNQMFPDISPSGQLLALTVATEDGGLDLFLANLVDRNVTRLTDYPQNDLWPRFDKTGEGLYFFSRRDTDGQSDDVYHMTLATRQIVRLTDADDHDFVPSTSPDGQFVAFAARRSGSPQLFIMSTDGRSERLIETPGLRVSHPVWDKSGSKIYFTGRPLQGGPADIYLATLP